MPFHSASCVTSHEAAALVVDVADEERRVAVAVHAVEIDRDVAVDDVAVEQRAVVGDAVADHFVDRGAQRLRESLVVQRARVAAARDARLVADAVELVGRHADLHRVGELEQDLAPGAARGAHAVGELVGRHRGNERRRVGRVRRPRDRRRHRAVRRQAPGPDRRPAIGVAAPHRRDPAPRLLLLLLPFAHRATVCPVAAEPPASAGPRS